MEATLTECSLSVTLDPFGGRYGAAPPRRHRSKQPKPAAAASKSSASLTLPSLDSDLSADVLYGLVPSPPVKGGPRPPDPIHGRPRSFLEELRKSPRKPRPVRLPKLRGLAAPVAAAPAATTPRPSLGRSARSTTSVQGSTSDAADQPLELLTDVRWILFPSTLATQPRERELSAAQRTLGTAEYDALAQVLRKVRILRGLSDADLHAVACACRLRSYPRYSAIVRAASPGVTCCVVVSGVAAVLGGGRAVYQGSTALVPTIVHRGAVFDEATLVSETLREASVSAVTDAEILTLTRDALVAALAPAPHTLAALRATAEWAEVQREVIAHLLSRRPFFRELSPSKLAGMAAMMDVRHFAPGQTIFREGDSGKSFYLLCDGAVAITKMADKPGEDGSWTPKTLKVYNRESDRPWFGEIALWLNKPRFGTALVREPTRLLVLEGANFEAWLALVPEFRTYLNRRNMYHESVKILGAGEAGPAVNAAALRLASSGRLGGRQIFGAGARRLRAADRAIFAERWERLVYNLLNTAGRETVKTFVSRVSLKVDDYQWKEPQGASLW